MSKKTYARLRLFKSNYLEAFSYVHPIVPFIIYLPIIFFLLCVGSGSYIEKSILFVCGLFFWSLVEYSVHRFIFHKIFHSKRGQRISFLMHGVHHKESQDPLRLVMPPILSVLVILPVVLFFFLVLPSYYFFGCICGFISGYLLYDYTHYALHYFNFKNRVFKYLKTKHFAHHYKNPKKNYGVSSPIWDFIFKTYR